MSGGRRAQPVARPLKGRVRFLRATVGCYDGIQRPLRYDLLGEAQIESHCQRLRHRRTHDGAPQPAQKEVQPRLRQAARGKWTRTTPRPTHISGAVLNRVGEGRRMGIPLRAHFSTGTGEGDRSGIFPAEGRAGPELVALAVKEAPDVGIVVIKPKKVSRKGDAPFSISLRHHPSAVTAMI
jgi:hypothetical protein